jgi:hypothetical protein
MSVKSGFFSVVRFLAVKSRRRLALLVLISLFALGNFVVLGLVRRTFVFYSVADRSIIVEDRMLKRSGDRETDIARYVEEVLLGPVTPDLAPLFPLETRLRSLLYRDGVVYVDLSDPAALPPVEEEPGVLGNFQTLYQGILRNFSYAREVRLFIAGNTAFAGQFSVE